ARGRPRPLGREQSGAAGDAPEPPSQHAEWPGAGDPGWLLPRRRSRRAGPLAAVPRRAGRGRPRPLGRHRGEGQRPRLGGRHRHRGHAHVIGPSTAGIPPATRTGLPGSPEPSTARSEGRARMTLLRSDGSNRRSAATFCSNAAPGRLGVWPALLGWWVWPALLGWWVWPALLGWSGWVTSRDGAGRWALSG